MKFLYNNPRTGAVDRIQCSAEHMVQCLGIITQEDPESRYGYLVRQPTFYGTGPQAVFMFRSGAKLYFNPSESTGEWWVSGHGNGMEARAAILELRAADHVRQAINLMSNVDAVMHRPRSLCVKYRGLWGTWPNGSRVPSELNNEPFVEK